MKFLLGPLIVLSLAGCAMRHPVNVSEATDEIRINRFAKVPLKTVQQIADARGGKEDDEIWFVDRHRGDIRIRKSKAGSKPDDDVELWYQDADGSWIQR